MVENLEQLEVSLPTLAASERLAALVSLADYFIKRDNRRALEYASAARDLALQVDDPRRAAESLLHIGRVNFRLSDYDAAEANLKNAQAEFEKIDDQARQACSLLSLGSVCLRRGEYPQALEYYLAAHAKYQSLGLKQEESKSLNNLGIVHADLGNYSTALEYYLEALRLADAGKGASAKEKDLELIAVIETNIADALLYMERWEDCLEHFERSLQIAREIKSRHDENIALTSIGEVYVKLGRSAEAKKMIEAGLILSRELGDREREVRTLSLLGKVHAAENRFAAAAACYRLGLKLSRTFRNPQGEISLHLGFADFCLQVKKYRFALKHLKKALELGERVSLRAEVCQSHELLVAVYEACGDYRQALSHHKKFQQLKQRLHGESQDQRIEALLVKHEVEKTRQIAETQRILNEELRRVNAELAKADRQNKKLLERLKHQARHDALTGLPNRTMFEDRLKQAVAVAARYRQSFAVMFIDLDGFKLLNDTLGHDAGDELLVQASRRFGRVLRESDTVARLGGDEFTVIALNISEPGDAAAVARKLLDALQASFEIRGHQVSVGASIGISLFPQDGADAVTLQKHADVAMYRVKHSGKRDWRFYSPEMNAAAAECVLIDTQLRVAPARDESG